MALFGQEHVDRYRATDGAEGHDWLEGAPTLLLTTTGRKSGEPRTMPLIYGHTPDGEVMVVGSKGGWDKPPIWFLNLEANPEVEVQVKADVFKARARVATPEEKPELWRTMVGIWPHYDEYQASTEREIPVVVLERLE
jgi:deazaflavin-dependent oxidoreductase (nitroreductase family)